ncbi:MAG TPA: hypothetical protein VGO04_21910 [Ensifer sp.]|jgi:hypothetical protein|uniref:hypothetical protein n=1 Tax=Ensifer sp. TaxID=1872086 RepID=UPI002E144828|nr:hypothetical protein [Ensifer sp.]
MKFKHGFKLSARTSRRLPTEYFVLANAQPEGAVIGSLGDQAIRETVTDQDGQPYRFVGVAPRRPDGGLDVQALRPGEWIVQPGLVYAAAPKETMSARNTDRAA